MNTTHSRLVGVAVALSSILPTVAFAQMSISLDGVPDRLRFPLPEGTNQVLTATIKGGQVKTAWLAVQDSHASSRRVVLAKIGEFEYAVNLGAQEVYSVLRTKKVGGQFRIFAEAVDGTIAQSLAVRYTMFVLPESLDFPCDEARMTIYQRTSKWLPGADGALRVQLGDITAGQVAVTIHGPRSELFVETMSMRNGDTLSLPLADQDYVLRLDKLVNLLIGQDYGVFSLIPVCLIEVERIDALLRLIESAGATFIRNDQELSNEAFAALLRAKHQHYGRGNVSVTDFIDQVATRSSTTGKRYRVKLPDGDVLDADTWLRQQAANIVVVEPEENDEH